MPWSFKKLGCMITCALHAIPQDLLEEFCNVNDMVAAAWVTEPHQNPAISHTHLVVMSNGEFTFRVKEIAEFFGRYCNVQPLKKMEDVYLSMAYLCKHKMPYIWAPSPRREQITREHVLAAFRSYCRRSPKSAREKLLAQLQRMENTWELPSSPVPGQNPSQDNSQLVSGSAHDFFPSQ